LCGWHNDELATMERIIVPAVIELLLDLPAYFDRKVRSHGEISEVE
jgi:hypothetical protein